jgi:hypothetical protein
MNFGGFDVTHPINRIRAGVCALAVNVRAYLGGGFSLRNRLTGAIYTLSAAIQTIARLNDTTPAGPVSGYTLISSDASGNLYNNSTNIATGLSGNPVSLVPFRPNTSVQPWMYVGDNSQAVTLTTKFAIDGTSTTFACFGQVKVRSDGLIYKTGIKEPQTAPVVSTSGTTTTGTDALPATTIPWTNVGGANPSYNYGHTSGADGTAPVIILTPVGSQTLTLVITGSATVNSAVHAPGDTGPATNTYPAYFTGAGPTIVVGAFTSGSGTVLTGTSPVPLLANVGAGITLQVPAGAVNFQVGIDSAGNTFSANSGSFSIAWTLVTSAIATKLSTLGNVTAYYQQIPASAGGTYNWKNPNDVGTGTPFTTSIAQGSPTNNSWQFDSNSSTQNDQVASQWDTLDSTGALSGSIPLFTTPVSGANNNFDNYNASIVGTLFVPAAGVYNFSVQYKDQIMLAFGGGATIGAVSTTGPGGSYSSAPTVGQLGQTMTVINALPFTANGAVYGFVSPTSNAARQGTYQVSTFAATFYGPGQYALEIDYCYWYHTGRTMVLTCNSAAIPPLPSGVRTNVSYDCKYRSSLTGAQSNPGPASEPQLTPVLDNTVSCPYSPDPQVDKVDYYRQDSGLSNYTYVATGPNTNPPTPIVDALSDTAAAANQIMQVDDFEPVPSIDLPKSGVVNVSGGVISWVSGDKFNLRWLPGTVILIGSPTQLAYSFVARPTSITSVTIPNVPDGTALAYNIAEPILANQPLAYLFGPTDNINFTFGVGDPLRPGTLYWCKGSNLDSWPDTNQMDVTDPSEPLVNGAMSGGRGVLFSIKRAWVIMPNFFNAQATVTGTSGSTWSLQDTSINRGLFIPRCLAVEGGGNIFFRVDDGIHVSQGGLNSKSISDEVLYPLFSHEGSTPQSVTRDGITVYPPDDSQPLAQKFSIQNGYLYYDYLDTNSVPRSLVFDIAAMGWVWDVYANPVTTRTANEGESVQGILVGCSDGTIRQLTSTGTETGVTGTVLTPAIGGQGWMHFYEMTVEYKSSASVTITPIAADAGNGSYAPPVITIPSTSGAVTKYTFKVGANKWKLIWFSFASTDKTMQIYLDGFAIEAKEWGSSAAYRPIVPFSGAFGGEGGQP